MLLSYISKQNFVDLYAFYLGTTNAIYQMINKPMHIDFFLFYKNLKAVWTLLKHKEKGKLISIETNEKLDESPLVSNIYHGVI